MAKILFVTGKLAAPALRATLEAMAPPFEYDIAVLRITVAALMTAPWIAKHLPGADGFDRVLIPGLCEGDVRVIQDRFGVPVEKGPADLRDLPEHFGQAALREGYGAYDIRIFARSTMCRTCRARTCSASRSTSGRAGRTSSTSAAHSTGSSRTRRR
jgi:hypothetical protein